MFSNECLGELNYEGTTSAVVMAGILLAFLIESMSHRIARKFSMRSEYNDEIVSILVLETGILFHSIREFLPSSGSRCHLGLMF